MTEYVEDTERDPEVYAESRSGPDLGGIPGSDRGPARLVLRRGICTPFSPVRFRVEGIQRVEYGEPGEYVAGGWHFPDTSTLKLELGLTCFDAADAAPLEEDIVDGVITYQSTFQEIHRCAARRSLEYYSEGETQRLMEGGMAFLKRWIAWEQYEFYFYGKSRKTKVSGFHCVQPE